MKCVLRRFGSILCLYNSRVHLAVLKGAFAAAERRSPTSVRWFVFLCFVLQAIVPIAMKSRRAILLSGTPALSRPSELFTQLNLLSSTTWASFREFGKRYYVFLFMRVV